VEGALFGKRAEALEQYLLKGTLISVTLNNVRAETFTKQDGTSVSKLVGDVIEIELCPDGKGTTARPAPPPPAPRPPPAPAAKTGFDDMDDDIPF
jgi:single-strand DNA-binding protein